MKRLGFPRLADGQAAVVVDGTAYRERDFRREDEPSFTLTSKARSWSIFAHDTREGPISASQCGVLQSFRPDYPWNGSRTAQIEQIANAVPPSLSTVLLDFVSN